MSDHGTFEPDRVVVLRHAGSAVKLASSHSPALSVAFALVLGCCDDHPDSSMLVLSTLAEAGRLIACVTAFAAEAGLSAALSAAIDQGQTWVKDIPEC
jgi:hypothetical protein